MVIKELSVFFPAYNEEGNVEKTVRAAVKVLERTAHEWEIIIVNDGSTDKTEKIAKKLASKNPFVRVISHRQNRGYGAALKSGFYNARYPWIAFSDADGQFDFSEIERFIRKQGEAGADLVVGYYLRRAVPFYRKLGTFAWNSLMFLLFKFRVKNIDCGFKLLRKEVIEKIPRLEAERGAFISTELLVKARRGGFKIVEVGVHHFPRVYGKETGPTLKVVIGSFRDLFRLWRKLKD